MLPDEDGGVQSWCWPLFGQVWRMPMRSSGRWGPSAVTVPSPCGSRAVLHTAQSWGNNPICRTISLLLSPESQALARQKCTWVTMARIRLLDTLEWHAALLGWGTHPALNSCFIMLFAPLLRLNTFTLFGISCLVRAPTIFLFKHKYTEKCWVFQCLFFPLISPKAPCRG